MEKFKESNRSFSRVLVLDNPKKILPCGWNIALEASTGDLILRVDAHSSLPNDFISKNVNRIDMGEKIVGGHRISIIDEDNSYISEEIIKVIEDLEDIDVVPLKKSDYKIKLITKQIQMVVIINKGFENNMLNLKNANLIIKSTSQSDMKSIIQSILKVRLEDLTTISKLSEGNINKFKTLYTDYKDIPTQLSLNDIKK